jgi:hypothetical protein
MGLRSRSSLPCYRTQENVDDEREHCCRDVFLLSHDEQYRLLYVARVFLVTALERRDGGRLLGTP